MSEIFFWEVHERYARYWCCDHLKDVEQAGGQDVFNENFHRCENYMNQINNPLKLEEWNPPQLCFFQEDKRKKYKLGDCHSAWTAPEPILISQNMIDKIGHILEIYGVWLPLDVEGREDDKLYRYWVTNELECIDKEKSKIDKGFASDYFEINKLTVDDKNFDGSMIFRVKDREYIGNQYFVTKEFIDLIKEHKLKGFMFFKCNPVYTEGYYGNDTDCKEKPILVG